MKKLWGWGRQWCGTFDCVKLHGCDSGNRGRRIDSSSRCPSRGRCVGSINRCHKCGRCPNSSPSIRRCIGCSNRCCSVTSAHALSASSSHSTAIRKICVTLTGRVFTPCGGWLCAPHHDKKQKWQLCSASVEASPP